LRYTSSFSRGKERTSDEVMKSDSQIFEFFFAVGRENKGILRVRAKTHH